MPRIVQIGNSMGVRIPKTMIEQADLAGRDLELRIVDEGLLVSPVRKPREGWEQAFEAMHATGDDEPLIADTPNTFDEDEWEW